MTQLWINGDRIDGLEELKRLFECAEQTQIRLCCELLRRLRDGILLRWIRQQDEIRYRAQVDYDIESGLSGNEDDRIVALANLCGIGREVAEAAVHHGPELRSDRLRSLIEAQPWYGNHAGLFRTVQWDHVVDNSSGSGALNDLLRCLHEEGRGRTGDLITDIYLCDVTPSGVEYKTPFIVWDVAHLRNLRMVGLGKPNVHFKASDIDEEFDFVERRVQCVGFRPNTKGLRTRNEKDLIGLELPHER